jgi:hypothetical protein
MLLLWTFCWPHASLLVDVFKGVGLEGRFLMSICVATVAEAPFHFRRDGPNECLWISFASESIYIYSFCLFLRRPTHGEGSARVQYRPGYGQRGGCCALVLRGEGQPPTRTKRGHVVPWGKFQLLFTRINNIFPLTVLVCARVWQIKQKCLELRYDPIHRYQCLSEINALFQCACHIFNNISCL